jgi:hypothetical protein
MSTRAVPPRRLWWLIIGFALWCSALATLYGLHAIGCAFAWPVGALRATLTVGVIAYVAAIGWLWRVLVRTAPDSSYGPTGSFLHWVFLGTIISAFAAAIVAFAPPLLLTACV